MKRVTMFAGTLAALCAFAVAPTAHADEITCQFPVVVIAIAGPVTMTCGDGNNTTTNHSTVVQVDPSLQVNPHLFSPAP